MVGSQVQPVRRHRPDYQIILFSGILLLLSLVVLFSISPARVETINQAGHNLAQSHFMISQFVYLLIGVGVFYLAANLPLGWWQKYSLKLVMLAFAACVLLAFLGLMHSPLALCANGACRWFNLGFTTFQPAELLKFALLIYTAGFLGQRYSSQKINNFSETLVPLGAMVVVSLILIIGAQKDMGTGITLLGMMLAMLVVAGIRWRLLISGLAAMGALGILFIVTSPHRIERVITFLAPSTNDAASNYHIEQASIALGSGGLTGVGLGHSVQAFGYLPEAQNDSIFAILGEIGGFIGVVVVLIIFFVLFLRLLKIVDNLIDPVTKFLVAGIFGWLATHTVVNIGAMIGVFPLTGVTLPFLSFGGTSLMFTMLILGLAFQASRYTSHHASHLETQSQKGESYAITRRRRGIGRTRNASSRGN